jgi:hypothetical protein
MKGWFILAIWKTLFYSGTTFVAKSSYIIIFAFTYVSETLAMLYGDELYVV